MDIISGALHSPYTFTTFLHYVSEYGQLLTFGNNKYGQLGLGDFREHPGINLVSSVLAGRSVTQVSCGDNFTVIATNGEFHHLRFDPTWVLRLFSKFLGCEIHYVFVFIDTGIMLFNHLALHMTLSLIG